MEVCVCLDGPAEVLAHEMHVFVAICDLRKALQVERGWHGPVSARPTTCEGRCGKQHTCINTQP